MDANNKEKDKRDMPYIPETRKRDSMDAFFTKLCALLQTHGYLVTEDRAKKLQSTHALSQEKEDKVSQETSREKSDWIPSFHSYKDFQRMALQSLDGFMIILSTDGVIIFVAENISSLLGYSPDEIMGKKLLSLLPDEEKREVYGKIALKLPVSRLVGKHNEFCCHLRRGNVKYGDSPTYEHVKFIMSIKDLSKKPLMPLNSFFPNQSYAESSPTYIPLEDQFYMVGTICILRAQILQELCGVKETDEDIVLIQDSDEKHPFVDCRSVQDQRSSRMESLCVESPAAASDDEVESVDFEQHESKECVPVIKVLSDKSSETIPPSLESVLGSPGTSSLQSFGLEPEVGDMEEVEEADEVEEEDEMEEADDVEEEDEVEEADGVEEVDEVEEVDGVEEADGVEEVDEVEEAEQETPSSSTMPTDISAKLLQVPWPIRSYIKKRELELMKKFRQQLEEKTQMLHANLRIQKNALDMMKEQLTTLQDSKLKMLVTPSHHIGSLKSQPLEPVPKKQRIEKVQRLLPDLTVTRCFCTSCSSPSFKFPEELGKSSDASTQTQPIVVPLQFIVEQQPSGYYQDENLGVQKDERYSFFPENQQGSSMNPLPLPHKPNSETTSSTSFSHPPITSDSNEVRMETPQDYVQIWQQSLEPQHHLYLQVNTWPRGDQVTMQDQATWPQVLDTETRTQEPSGPQAFQDPAEYSSNQVNYFLSVDQSNPHEQLNKQFFHTKP